MARILLILVALAGFTAAVTPATAGGALAPAPAPPAIIIDDSPGGTVVNFKWFYAAIKNSGIPVRLRGICLSSCTFILSLPSEQVCVEKTGVLGFHPLSNGAGGRALPEVTYSIFLRSYPKAVIDVLASKPVPAPGDFIYLGSRELVLRGLMRPCEEGED